MIIDSSICVAVITILPRALVSSMARFWMSGTFSGAHLDAEIAARHHDAVGASTISSSRSTASGFSILAMIGTRLPSARRPARCASTTSSGERTNDSATKSTPSCSPNARSRRSLSVSAGAETFDAGQVDALVVLERAADEHARLDVGVARRDRPRATAGRRRAAARRRASRRRGSAGVGGRDDARRRQARRGGQREVGARLELGLTRRRSGRRGSSAPGDPAGRRPRGRAWPPRRARRR